MLRDGANISADESMLSGESVPVAKNASLTATTLDRPGGDSLSSLFSGSLVTAGHGVAEVLATGPRSQFGRIGASLLTLETTQTPLQQETRRLVRVLAIVGAGLCCLVVVAYVLSRGGDADGWRQGLLSGIALAMAILPEELPVILTIFLAIGAWRISQHRVLARRMPAIETLGSATVLCTDKTGTLTINSMSVRRIDIAGRIISIAGMNSDTEVQGIIGMAILASRQRPNDPMELAIRVASGQGGEGPVSRHDGLTLVREFPLAPDLLVFTQAWRTAEGGPLIIAAKGAPEAIVGLCGFAIEQREIIAKRATAMAIDGLRVLAVASARMTADRLPASHRDLRLEYIGLIGLEDPLRPEAAAAISECHAAGIRVVMITGDHPATAQSIARQAGIDGSGEVITGVELEAMQEADLVRRIESVNIFARVHPEQKLRIVRALKARDEVVAMTGDGVNDAPALKAAHIGIAMGRRGSDVARESASLVLLDDDFASIVAAVRMGRRIFDNIKKAVSFTIAVHVPIAGLSILPVLLLDWPTLLLPVHIVFLELVIDPACTLIFEAEEPERDIMRRLPRRSDERLFSMSVVGMGVLQGAVALAICVGVFVYSFHFHDADVARTMTFAALVSIFIAMIISNRSRHGSIANTIRTKNVAQMWVVSGAVVALSVILAVPMARELFHFSNPSAIDLATAASAGLLFMMLFEVVRILRTSHVSRERTADGTGTHAG